MRIILAPDSFKGTLSAGEICRIERAAVLERFPGAEVICIPMADGGEGMAAAYRKIIGGEKITAEVCGPLGRSDLVITGEGRMDAQSANGKVPMGVGLRCRAAGVPCIAICGSLGEGAEEMRNYGVSAMYAAAESGYAGAEDIRRATLRALP